MALLIGVDGGGTRTRVLVADSQGIPLGYAVAGPSNPKAVGLDGCVASICDALTRALQGVDRSRWEGASLFAGLAGVRTAHDAAAVKEVLQGRLQELSLGTRHLELGRDLEVALAGSLQGEPGIVLVVGTGSAAFGRNEKGEIAQAGGWGWYIDDPGSGYWMGYRAMRAAARAEDGRANPNQLQGLVKQFLRLRSLDEMPNVIYNPHFSRERVAELCPLIFQAAADGDPEAREIIAEGTAELALMVGAVARRLGLSQHVRIALNGGVIRSGELFGTMLRDALGEHLSKFTVLEPRQPPVVGAVILAASRAGSELGADAIEALSAFCNAASITPAS